MLQKHWRTLTSMPPVEAQRCYLSSIVRYCMALSVPTVLLLTLINKWRPMGAGLVLFKPIAGEVDRTPCRVYYSTRL